VKIKSQRDFFAGLLFMAAGIAFAWGATNYDIGNSAHMGPGYFPLVLGIVLAALGGFMVFESLVFETEDGERIGAWAWKPLGAVIVANVVFGVMIGGLPSFGLPPMGMVAAVVVLTFIAAFASDRFKVKEVAVLSIALAAVSYVAFIVLLKLQVPVWPWFIG
jgi:hypothetical protein